MPAFAIVQILIYKPQLTKNFVQSLICMFFSFIRKLLSAFLYKNFSHFISEYVFTLLYYLNDFLSETLQTFEKICKKL